MPLDGADRLAVDELVPHRQPHLIRLDHKVALCADDPACRNSGLVAGEFGFSDNQGAESSLLPGNAQVRAAWEAAHRSGHAVCATLTVPEWRAGNPKTGRLWKMNQIAHCSVPRLGLSETYLISEVEHQLGGEEGEGRRTVLSVAPRSAFMPEPAVTAAIATAVSRPSSVARSPLTIAQSKPKPGERMVAKSITRNRR